MWYPRSPKAIGFWIGSLVLLLSACGYRLQGPESLAGGIRTVAVPVFRNQTNEPGLETEATRLLVEELNRRGTLKVVPLSRADAVLYGTLKRIRTSALSYGADRHAVERRVILNLDIRLVQAGKKRILWKADDLRFQEAYGISRTDPLVTDSNRRKALIRILENLSEKVYERMVLSF